MTAVSQVKCFALHNVVVAFNSKLLREVNLRRHDSES